MTQEKAIQLVNFLRTYFPKICFNVVVPLSQFSKCAALVEAFPTKTYIYFCITQHRAHNKFLNFTIS
jgi:hypothetical protein